MRVAIVGASGAVGQEFLKVLEERNFPMDELVLFGSARSAGKKYTFKGNSVIIKKLLDTGVDARAFFGIKILRTIIGIQLI